MQGLLSAYHLGVLGLTVTAADTAIGDEWVATVLETVHWVLRLLPITAGQPVRVDIQVEARGEYRSSVEWTVASYQLLRELHFRAPGRFDGLALDLAVAPKRALDAQHPWADLVAHTWAGRSDASRARLAASELRGACLVDGDAAVVKRAWDELDARGHLEGDTWRATLAEPSANSPRSVLAGLLTRLGAACRDDVGLWGRYLDACSAHLDGKAVDLARLGHEVDWLATHRPADAKPLPAPLELAWITARLEAANHVGDVADADAERLEQLSVALYDECPQLVCQADLDRAVRATNRFAFDEASQRLSDVAAGRLEASQTSAYRAIAAMDAPGADPAQVRDLVARLRPVDLPALETTGRDGAPASKYAHHVVLRWLAQHGTEPERRAYLPGRTKWAQGHGHPWPLIAAYRAVLLPHAEGSPAEVQRHWNLATSGALAVGQGEVIRFIGLVLAHAARAAGASDEHDLPAIEGELLEALPSAPWLALEAARDDGGGALAVMRRVLPFNFR